VTCSELARQYSVNHKTVSRVLAHKTWVRSHLSLPRNMPKEACRLKLSVKRVWLERVQEISGADARAEGCSPPDTFACPDLDPNWPRQGKPVGPRACVLYPNCACGDAAVETSFALLWDSIYAHRPIKDEDGKTIGYDESLAWDTNPWVWCSEFEVQA
jgi:hypothetical protein